LFARRKFDGKVVKLLAVNQRDPQLFRDRRLTETMATVLANAQEKYFLVERADGTPRELRVLLNREPMKPVAPKQP